MLDHNAQCIDAIGEFVAREGPIEGAMSGVVDGEETGEPSFPPQLPTGLVFAGVNVTDHELIFNQMVDSFADSSNVVLLRSIDCSTLPAAFKIIVRGLTDGEGNVGPHATMDDVHEWYRSAHGSGKPAAANKRRRVGKGKGKADAAKADAKVLVVAITDFTSFDSQVVADLIYVLGRWRNRLPLLLLLGLSTSIDPFHQLPRTVSVLMRTRKFQLVNPVHHMDGLIDGILMKEDGPLFRLGHKAFAFLMDNFLLFNLTLDACLATLRFMVLDHCYDRPLTRLCLPGGEDALDVAGDDVRALPSFRNHVQTVLEAGDAESALHVKKLITDDAFLAERVREWTAAVRAYLRGFRGPFFFFHRLLQGTSGGRCISHREWYLRVLQGGAAESRVLRDWFRTTARNLPVERLRELVKAAADEFLESETRGEFAAHVDDGELGTGELVEKLEALARRALFPYTDLVMHEFFFYNESDLARRTLNAQPRAALQTALQEPRRYLIDHDGKLETGDDEPFHHDTVTAFYLYQQAGKMINLVDWFSSFSHLVDPASQDASKTPIAPKVLQARFARAVTELQMMGFVKSTKRKTDHVAKLAFGRV